MTGDLYSLLAHMVLADEGLKPPRSQDLNKVSLPALLDLAWSEKVFPAVYAYLSAAGYDTEVGRKHYDAFCTYRSQYQKTLGTVGPDILMLKGFALEHYYPEHQMRFAVDLDLGLRDLDMFWKVGSAFFNAGHEIPGTMLWLEDPLTKTIWASGRMELADLPSRYYGYELQVGMFPTSWATYLPWVAFGSRILDKEENLLYRRLDPTGQLAILLAEYVSRRHFKLRDVYDLVRLLKTFVIDYTFITQIVRDYAMERAIDVMREGFARLPDYKVPFILQQLFDEFPTGQKRQIRSVFWGHILPYLRQRYNSRFPTKICLMQFLRGITYRLNTRSFVLPLLRFMERGKFVVTLFRYGHPIYMIYLGHGARPIQWLRIGRFAVMRTPLGYFLASANAVVTDQELDAVTMALSK